MGELSLLVVLAVIGLLWVSRTVNHIPKTGRDGKAAGEKITATITNENKNADSAAILRAEKDGRKFKVKMKPTEAHLWIKGDDIDIVLSDDSKSYRILFNDYFRKNESRLREAALKKLEKTHKNPLASAIVKYKKENYADFAASDLDSQQIFAFETYMRIFDRYVWVLVAFVIAVIAWKTLTDAKATQLIIPGALVLGVAWSLYNTITVCQKIFKNVQKKLHK